MPKTALGIAYDRAGTIGSLPIVFVHAGIADRRMWEPQWSALTAERDVLRLDLRGFGQSDTRPAGRLDPTRDLLDTLAELRIDRCHLVGASYGAGVVTELAVTRPELAASLLLSAPGGSLMTVRTPDLEAFFAAEEAALATGDLDAAVEANLATWVDGPGQPTDRVASGVRAQVALMQQRVFELGEAWGELEEAELEPPVVQRLSEVAAPTVVLVGDLDLDVVKLAARAVTAGVAGATLVEWAGVAHLPSLERPEAFLQVLRELVDAAE